ncbi:septum site-determining protein MinC [Ignatzschineria ureiclastica]|uniref:Probable septum site-determining protein MinC n=1 Tax=Ignatzschineria ureiclastica TaxID=472582 RepID=A0A2U2AFB5_9GAMM|nr:septum site-determining protein MinC [Ignatzschineria ureiclastica]PWD81340.1 septum site-determining protein MinC [Ignatzschineria ureiclastica]
MSHQKTFQIKGELSTLMVLYINGIDLKALEDDLSKQIERSPQLFKGLPIVVDLIAIETGNSIDLNWLKNLLLARDLVPVGLRNVNESLQEKAKSSGWAILADSANKSRQVEALASTEAPKTATTTTKPVAEKVKVIERVEEVFVPIDTTLHVQQVRSGQQLSVPKGDLVVVNSVNEGAELLVDGNIHIYGSLRGRALAGINGNQSVRIFCQSLEAELLSIAGFYKMQEDIPAALWGKSVQIFLEDEELKIIPLIR